MGFACASIVLDYADPPSPPRCIRAGASEERCAWKDVGHGCRPAAANGPACLSHRAEQIWTASGPRECKLRSSRSLGEALCLLLSADEGQNLTRQGDCLATVSGRSPA